MEENPVPQDELCTAGNGAKRAKVIAAEEGAWVQKLPPDTQPQFRCIRHGRGALPRGSPPVAQK